MVDKNYDKSLHLDQTVSTSITRRFNSC